MGYMKDPFTKKQMGVLEKEHDLVSAEKDPEKRKKIHDKMRGIIMDLEVGKFKLMGLPEKEINLHKVLVEKRELLMEQLTDNFNDAKGEPEPKAMDAPEKNIDDVEKEIAGHLHRWFMTHNFDEL